MGRWLDSFGVGIPVVEYEDDAGRRMPVPRADFERFGAQFDGGPSLPEGAQSAFGRGALAPPPPEIDLSAVNASDVAAAQFDAAGIRPMANSAGLGGMPVDNGIDAVSGVGAPPPPMLPPGALAEQQQRDTVAAGPGSVPAPAQLQQFTADQAAMLAKYQPQQVGAGQAVVSQETPAEATASTDATQQADYGGGALPSLREQALVGATDVAQREADATAAEIISAGQGMDIAEVQRQKDLEADRAEYDRLNREYGTMVTQEAATKIDPGRKFRSMSTGSKVLAVLGAVLSGAGSVLKKQGDKNPALDILMAAFQEDIALQMDERAQLGRNVAAKRGQLDKFAEVAQTRDGIRLAGIATMATREARRLREIAAKSASERVQFDALGLAADLEGAAAAAQAQGLQSEYDNWLKGREDDRKERELGIKERKAMGGGGGGLAGKTGTDGAYASLDQIDPKFRDKAVRLPDGSWIITNSREAAKEATAAVAGSTAMVDNIDRALTKITSMPGFASKIAGKAGWENQDTQVINQEMSQLVMAAKEYYKLGVISGPDLALIERLGADVSATKSFTEQQWAKLTNWRSGVTQDAASKLRAYGVDVDPGAAYGATPEKPRAKASGEWSSEVTSSPTRDSSGAIIAVPDDIETSIKGMRESFIAEGKSDKEWQGELGALAARSRDEMNKARNRIADLKKQAAAVEKKGGKDASEKAAKLKLRIVEEAAAMSRYDGNAKKLIAAKSESIEEDVKRRKAQGAKDKAEKANKAKRDDFGSAGRNI